MASRIRSAALAAALVLTTGCTSSGPDPDQGGQCIDGKCDGFGGAEVLSPLSQTLVNMDSLPRGFAALGGKALFFSGAQRGLWISDGTAAGTKLVRDLRPTLDDYQRVPKLVVFNGKAYYSFMGALWVTDGTPTGTTQVADFGSAEDRFMTDPFVFDGSLVFGVKKSLYISDGTAAGTQVLSPTEAYAPFVIVGNEMYFECVRSDVGGELCATDKTAAGTRVVKDIKPGIASTDPEMIGTINSKILFSVSMGDVGQRALWVTDGTDAGTVQIFAAPSNTDAVRRDAESVVLGGKLYFPCYTGTAGYELCTSDGTVAGTTPIDLVSGSSTAQSASPMSLTVFAGKLYFVGSSPTLGREVWSSDGTAAGSSVLADLRTSMTDKDGVGLTKLIQVGSKLVFAARGNGTRAVLYGTDGTAAGTQQIADVVDPGAAQRYALTLYDSVVVGNTLLFDADDGTHGDEPWATDGTAQGTHLLLDVAPPTASVRALESMTFGNGTYLGIDDGQATAVWRTNGVASGTGLFQQLDRQATPDFTAVGSTMYFTGWESLWKTEGTAASTAKIRDMPSTLGSLVAFGNQLAFLGGTANQSLGMWLSDGTANGTVESGAINAERLGSANGRLWLTALYGSAGNELFTSDGTAAGTQPVFDINSNGDSKPGGFVAVNGMTLFAATDAVAGRELWMTDGTAAGTQRIIDISPGNRSSSPSNLFAWKNMALMWASPTTAGYELWRTDGTAAGTTRVKAVTFGAATSFTAWGDYVFFVGHDEGGDELWRTDGTEAGTVRVDDIYPGRLSSSPTELVLASPTGPLYFVAEEPATGREIWKLTSATGTPELALDVLTGPHSSNPSQLRPRGTALLFVADDGHGPAVFRLGDEPDVIAPTIKCPADVTVMTSSQSGIAVNYADATADDNAGTPTVDSKPASGSLFPVGTTTVTATATDPASNTASCTFTVTVALAGGGSGSGSGSGSGTGMGGGGGEPGGGDGADDPGGCSTTRTPTSMLPLVLLFGTTLIRRRRIRRDRSR